MKRIYYCLWILVYICMLSILPKISWANSETPPELIKVAGHIENRRIIECSGLETSTAQPDLLWAINDGNNGPYLYALGSNGRHRGRFRIQGAVNRDWEGIDAFRWKNINYLLIADFGDNRRVHTKHLLYIIKEPQLNPGKEAPQGSVSIVRQIAFQYPDGGHDAEGVAVDLRQEKILLVTKRDAPPLMFEIPLFPPSGTQTITAKLVGPIGHLRKPTPQDMSHRYGEFRSQPTALDISSDGFTLALLTYKHAYLFTRSPTQKWATALTQNPQLILLPLPEETPELRQREAICFNNNHSQNELIITSEGMGAGIYHVVVPSE